MLTILSEGFYT